MLTLKHKDPSLRGPCPNCQGCTLLPKLRHIASGPEPDGMKPAQISSTATAHLCAMQIILLQPPSAEGGGGHDIIHCKKNSNNAWVNKTANLPALLHLNLAINTTI